MIFTSKQPVEITTVIDPHNSHLQQIQIDNWTCQVGSCNILYLSKAVRCFHLSVYNVVNFQAGIVALFTCQVMGCWAHAIEKAIRPFSTHLDIAYMKSQSMKLSTSIAMNILEAIILESKQLKGRSWNDVIGTYNQSVVDLEISRGGFRFHSTSA